MHCTNADIVHHTLKFSVCETEPRLFYTKENRFINQTFAYDFISLLPVRTEPLNKRFSTASVQGCINV